ncbi:mCG1042562, partial [Mus musculus]
NLRKYFLILKIIYNICISLIKWFLQVLTVSQLGRDACNRPFNLLSKDAIHVKSQNNHNQDFVCRDQVSLCCLSSVRWPASHRSSASASDSRDY